MPIADLFNGTTKPHPYIDAPGQAAHNDRYLNLAKDKWNWQVTAWLAMVVALVLGGALAYEHHQRKEYAYTVEVDEMGVARYVRELSPQSVHTPYVVQAQVAQFIREIRTVTTDKVAFMQQLNQSYSVCLKDAQTYIKSYYDAEQPLELVEKGISIRPQKIEASPLSENEYRVRWEEQKVQNGAVIEESRWEATVTVELTHPADLNKEQRQRNPLGVWVSNINWFSY